MVNAYGIFSDPGKRQGELWAAHEAIDKALPCSMRPPSQARTTTTAFDPAAAVGGTEFIRAVIAIGELD
jgi:hypothetical protein